MSDDNKIRLAHELLDEINARQDLTPRQVRVLRSFLPERPKRKTLEDVYREVCNAWYRTDGNVWKDETFGELEEWLYGLYEQLKGLIDSKPASPALPEGMRLADHEKCGRVVVSPRTNDIGQYRVFYLDNFYLSGADASYVEADALTFIDAEPALKPPFQAEPAHPEFLETEADYQSAPDGTIVACDDTPPCHKFGSEWSSVDFWGMKDDRGMSRAHRRVLRWGGK